jgi:hypothetical protein
MESDLRTEYRTPCKGVPFNTKSVTKQPGLMTHRKNHSLGGNANPASLPFESGTKNTGSYGTFVALAKTATKATDLKQSTGKKRSLKQAMKSHASSPGASSPQRTAKRRLENPKESYM